MKKGRVGSRFSEFLEEEGLSAAAEATAVKRVLAWQIEEAMRKTGISKSEMAKRMKTSRSQLDRLLDPANNKVQLQTLQRAATAIGKRLIVEFKDLSKAA